jgi:hypothetical protein
MMQEQTLVEKIKKLPPNLLSEVETFVSELQKRSEKESRKVARQEALAAYVAEHAGSDVDLDKELEATSIEHISETEGA